MKKIIYILFAAILIVTLSYYFYDRNYRQASAPSVTTSQEEGSAATSPEDSKAADAVPQESSQTKSVQDKPTAPSRSTYDAGTEVEISPDTQVWEVTYDGSKFIPETIDVKAGDIVIFRNLSGASFWPASNPHPLHSAYPEFDAQEPVSAGGKYQMQFLKTGKWGFHDHLNTGIAGVVNVSE